MSRTKKIALGLIIVLAVIAVAAVVLIPMLIDVDRYRPEVAAGIQTETGKPTQIGRLSLTLFPSIAIRVDDFAMGNPEGFPEGDFVKAKRIYAVVDGWALWNRSIVIKSLELDDPEINLLETARGQWNYESKPSSKPIRKAALTSTSSFTLGIISKVTVSRGHLTAANLSSSGRLEPGFFEALGVASQLADVDLNAFGGAATGSLASPSPTHVAQILSWASSVAYAASPESQPAAAGTLEAESLRFQTFRATSVKTKLRLYAKEIDFDSLGFDLYGGSGSGDVQFNFGGVNPRYNVKAKLRGVDMAKLLQEFPSGKGYMTGKLEGNIDLAGEVTHSPDPLAGVRGTGHVSIKNGNLPSLQLNKNLMELAKLSNLGPAQGDPGSFSSIDTDLNIANSRITNNKINIVGNGLTADGSGSMTMAGEGSLDYKGVASIAAGANQLTNILAGLSGATISNGKLNLPFGIGGTLMAPKFNLQKPGAGQLGALANVAGGKLGTNSQQQNPADLVKGIAGMFKKKKNP